MSAGNSDGQDQHGLDSRTFGVQTVLSNADRLGINYEALPTVPIWGPIFGYNNQGVKLNCAARVMGAAAIMKREPTQAEKDAIAYHTAKAYVTRAYAPPITLAVTYGFWRRGFATYRFPFHQPKPPRFNPLKFFFLRGGNAHWAWHGARFFLYGTFAHMTVGGLFYSYAVSVYLANMAADPRLHDFRETVKAIAGPAPNRPGQRRPLPMQRGGESAGENSRQGFGTYDDANPVSQPSSYGQDEDAAGRAFSGFARDTDDQVKQTREEVERQPRGRPGAFPLRQYKPEPPQSFSEDESDPFDDASPVAPSERQYGARQTSYGVSAWDRIRNQAKPQGDAQRPAPTSSWAQRREEEQTSRGAQDGSSYNYAQSDEDKAYAKSQAQKEFDEMIERERRGESDGRRRG